MTREQIIEVFSGGLGIVLLILVIAWGVFWMVMPFVIYAILLRLRRIHEVLQAQLGETNRLLRIQTQQHSGLREESEATRNPFGR